MTLLPTGGPTLTLSHGSTVREPKEIPMKVRVLSLIALAFGVFATTAAAATKVAACGGCGPFCK